MNSEKERLLCYSAGILGSYLANPTAPLDVPEWLMKRCIKKANQLITMIYDDDKLQEILND